MYFLKFYIIAGSVGGYTRPFLFLVLRKPNFVCPFVVQYLVRCVKRALFGGVGSCVPVKPQMKGYWCVCVCVRERERERERRNKNRKIER